LCGCLRGPVDVRAGGDLLLREAGRSALAACAPFGPWCRDDARAPRHAALLGRAPPLQPRRDHDAARRAREPVELARHAVVALRTPARSARDGARTARVVAPDVRRTLLPIRSVEATGRVRYASRCISIGWMAGSAAGSARTRHRHDQR